MSNSAMQSTEHGTRLGHGLVAGIGAAIVGALVLGSLQGSTGDRALEVGYWALGVGLLVGAVLGKTGGRPLLGIPLAMAGVLLTQLIAAAVHVGAADIGVVLDFWRAEMLGKNDLTFYLVAALEGYLVAKRVSEPR